MNTTLPPSKTAPYAAFSDLIEQNVDEASFLWVLRSVAVKQPHYQPADILEMETRIDANLDSIMTSLQIGWPACEAAMELQEPGEAFTGAVVAFRSREQSHIQAAVTSGLSSSQATQGLISALGWLPGQIVHPWIKNFLGSKDLAHKYLALAACSVRQENPDTYLNKILQRDDCCAHSLLYARALRMAGELKRIDVLSEVEQAMREAEDPLVQCWAHWAAVLLGQTSAVDSLQEFVQSPDPALKQPALNLAFRVLPLELARSWISKLAENPDNARTVIQATGILGDPQAVPWLINKMRDAAVARLAGEAFNLITGIDLLRHQLDVELPQDISVIPNDDPDDDNVAMDEDENLSWPDAEKVAFLWQKFGQHFKNGQRYFLGKPLSADFLRDKIKNGYQRQRQAAAYELALLEPTCMLVNTQARIGGER